MAITLKFLDGDNGYACPSGVIASVCGGRPPYTWTASNPDVTFDSNDPGGNPDCCNACNRGNLPLGSGGPPGNGYGPPIIRGICVKINVPTNPNPSEPGVAYMVKGVFHGSSCFRLALCESYGCNDSVITGCTAVGCAACDPDNCGPPASCPTAWCNPTQCAQCEETGLPVYNDNCIAMRTVRQYVCDLRTAAMKENGCNPCSTSMLNVVITVTDADGNSVSRVLKA